MKKTVTIVVDVTTAQLSYLLMEQYGRKVRNPLFNTQMLPYTRNLPW